MGLKLDDVRRLTFEEFESIVEEWNQLKEREHHDDWERMRMHATITIQPHTKKRIEPRALLPFPWEKTKTAPIETLSKEARMNRFKNIMNKKGK